uniref:Non-structural maintenance of chromosomes element 1 homolog n=1 Tax=Oryctolagus cuniculus TaxID=9986 RepID=A0A5F9DQU0_RABIT
MGAPHSLSPRLRGGSEPAFRPSVAGARGRGVPDAFREEKGASRKARRWTEVPSQMQGSTRKAGVMTDVHRRFLQLLMTHGVLEEWDMERLQRHCYKVHDCNAPIDRLEDFINNINSVLESLYIEIKKGVTEDDGRPIYALLELIIDSETGFASSTNILNLVDQLKGKKMRKKEAEQVLQKFVQNKWLIEKEGEFTLHSRAILEMEQYIRETFPDSVKSCNICHGLLIQTSLTLRRRGRPASPNPPRSPPGPDSISRRLAAPKAWPPQPFWEEASVFPVSHKPLSLFSVSTLSRFGIKLCKALLPPPQPGLWSREVATAFPVLEVLTQKPLVCAQGVQLGHCSCTRGYGAQATPAQQLTVLAPGRGALPAVPAVLGHPIRTRPAPGWTCESQPCSPLFPAVWTPG